MQKNNKTLRLILGDQLNASHSWYQNVNGDVLYVIAELPEETSYTKHHVQKICAFFMAMENFANALKRVGHHVIHLSLDDTSQYKNLPDLLQGLCTEHSVGYIEYQRPDEYRLFQMLSNMQLTGVVTTMVETEHFLLDYAELNDYFSPGKHHKMEFFYRRMRQRFTILMDGDQPLGGQWNYDAENRNKCTAKDIATIPQPLLFSHATEAVVARLDRHKVDYFGRRTENLVWPTTRKEAVELLEFFCRYCLIYFGRFQDAMTHQGDCAWSLYHSRLSFALNTKMISPKLVIDTALDYFYQSKGDISLAQIEGFVRQILGWREYIRGVYWVNMPNYRQLNALQAKRHLPEYFWNGKTKMHCLQRALGQSLDYAYAHHIQRLMVIGNFCLLSGIDPDEVDQWYLGVYIDALEWVEMPNTRGMSQFADGGLVATKPYCSGGNYIHKMGDYCRSCHYDTKAKVGDNACPFNSLYWHFLVRHREKFQKNHRLMMVYRNWEKQDESRAQAVLERAQWCLDNIDEL